MAKLDYLFPTPIYYNLATSDVLDKIQEEIKNAIDLNKDLSSPWYGEKISSSFKFQDSKNFVKDTPFFEEYILSHASAFAKNANVKIKSELNFEIKMSWYNVSKKGNFMLPHIHPGYDIAGVYYYQSNGKDGELSFKSDSSGLKNSIFSQGTIRCPPKTGLIILFPAFLEHSVFSNDTDSERISVSFNLSVK